MKLRRAMPEEFQMAMDMINDAKRHLKEQGIDQWQNGYPDEKCILLDIQNQKGYFFTDERGIPFGYVCIDCEGEPAYDHLNGTWNTAEPYVVAHRMAFSEKARGQGTSTLAFQLIEDFAREKNITSFRVDTDEDNKKMQHILKKNGFMYTGTIWFDNSEKIAFEKTIS